MMHKKSLLALPVLIVLIATYRVILAQPAQLPPESVINSKVKITQYPKLEGVQQQIRARELGKNTSEFIIYTRRYPTYSLGDILHIQGEVKKHHIVSHPKIKKEGNILNPIEKFLGYIRESFKIAIQKSLPEPHASLVLGMLLGIESDIPIQLEEDLKRTGTIHMLVVSGFNITLVSAFVMRLAGFLHRRHTVLIAMICVWVFVTIAGAQPPALRAGVMSSLVLVANYYGRQSNALYLLLLSATILLIISPELFYSLSFQLSCAATAGIILLPPLIKTHLRMIGQKYRTVMKNSTQKDKANINDYLLNEISSTLGAQLAVTPLILNSFGSLSIIAPIANIVVAWSIPYIMITGLCVGLAGLTHNLLGTIAAATVVPFTAFFLKVVMYTSIIPFAYFENIKINLVLSAGIYLVLVYTVIKLRDNKEYSKTAE